MTVSETSLFEEYVLPETKVFREEYSMKKNQDPKMEVLLPYKAIEIGGISPYIGQKIGLIWPYI